MQAESSHSGRSDHDLLAAVRAGDFGAFEEIVRRYRDRIYRMAHGMTASPSEAEEVVQETFLSLFRSLASFRGDSAVGTWIFRVASNTALMALRRRRRKPLLSIEDSIPEGVPVTRGLGPSGEWARQPDEKLLSKELGSHIQRALARLPEKYRLVLLLRDVEGLSNDEVAEALGITVPTVKSRLHRSRLFVRDELERYFGEH